MLASYFPDKNYALLYLHVFGDKIGNRLLELFTGVYFYYLGMPLPFILLFFGLEFGLRGVIAPLAPVLVPKIGVRRTILISYIFLIAFFVFAGLAQMSLFLGFFSFIFQSISRGIYYPCVDTLHSVFVRDGSRGKQYTLEIVWTIIAGVIAVAIGSSVLTDHFVLAILGIVAVLALSVVPLYFMDKPHLGPSEQFFGVYQHLVSREWRENLLPIGAESLAIIANVIIVPVFIFVLVKTPGSFNLVILLGLGIEAVLTLLYGIWMDRRGNAKTLVGVSFFQGAGNIGYLFAMSNPSALLFLNGLNNVAWDMFSSNYNTRLQQKAQKSGNPLLFNTSTQMTLCFVEVIALSIFALIAWQWGASVFIVIFLASIVGLYFSTRYFVD